MSTELTNISTKITKTEIKIKSQTEKINLNKHIQ